MDLKTLATKVASVYEQNAKVEAVYIAGSVARGWEDHYSDIELNVLWSEGPTDQERLSVIEQVEGQLLNFYAYEDGEWSETYQVDDVKFEISSFLTETIRKVVQRVTKEYDIELDSQCLIASIHYGEAVSGTEIMDGLKAKVQVYPEQLSHAMIDAHSDLGSRWGNRHALVEREDWLMLYSVMTSVQHKMMGILFGLNCMYVNHPAFKWQRQTLSLMNIKPENIIERLERVFLSNPKQGLDELEKIVQEMDELVKEKE
ncbi:DUF4037 domain-containing protein [Halobacillus shinanisalinarum]|uniref:DUF4037 domain-containing protein n=1 Tax=Halobacillus shinanisalinarum TaxID=2932258 RepID=A0ABY4H4N1_9BACI|nr:DUF4037 domain-containing protein [Halobacillus shinanisalinarum]UOQ95266.1 DUF4037 domain-containing protein [Halobacillus shinanisalinarum]